MPDRTVRIGELHLRVPGLGRHEARSLGEDVARRVANGLREQGRVGHLGALELRVTIPHGTLRDRLVQIVTDRILVGLQ
jgi:hypothetical protein